MSLKGGVGKSTITALLGKHINERYMVGFLDLDIHGPNLHLALGLSSAPKLGIDTTHECVIPSILPDGSELVTLASHWGEGSRVMWSGEKKIKLVEEMLTGVIKWGYGGKETEYLLIDCPPSTGDEILGLMKFIKNPYGIVLITQPSNFSTSDLDRAINMIREYQLPVIGVVENMSGCICPKCNNHFYAFSSDKVDIKSYCDKKGIRYLIDIPQVQSPTQLNEYGKKLADLVLTVKPVKLQKSSVGRKIVRTLLKKALTSI